MIGARHVIAALAAGFATFAQAAPLVVIGARGTPFKVGQRIDSARPVSLKPGEQLTLIASDGRTVTLRGAFSGPPLPRAAAAPRPGQALAALVAGRQARSSSVGVVRSGDVMDAPALPQPWLIDISRGGSRCLRHGSAPVWWRPDGAAARSFTVFPVDRSWRADFTWRAGQRTMKVPPIARFDGTTSFIIRTDGEEALVTVERAPATLDTDLMLAAWMIEKGCTQQGDGLLA